MRYVIVMIFLAMPASALTFDKAFRKASEAAETCENAWFPSSREHALKSLDEAGTRMALALNPLSQNHDQQVKRMQLVSDWLANCTSRVHE